MLACWAQHGAPSWWVHQPRQEAPDWCHWLLGEAHQIQPRPAADNGPRPQGRKLRHAGGLPGEPALPGTASPCGGELGLFRCPSQLGSDSQPHPSYWLSCPFTCHRGGRQAHCASPGFLMCALQKSSEPGAHHLLCIGAPWASGQMGEAPALTQGPPGSLPTAPSRRAPSPSASCQVPAGSQRAHGPLAGPGPLVSWGSHPGERPTLCSFFVLHTLQPVLLPEAWVLVASPPLLTWGGRRGMSQGCSTLARFLSLMSGDQNSCPVVACHDAFTVTMLFPCDSPGIVKHRRTLGIPRQARAGRQGHSGQGQSWERGAFSFRPVWVEVCMCWSGPHPDSGLDAGGKGALSFST